MYQFWLPLILVKASTILDQCIHGKVLHFLLFVLLITAQSLETLHRLIFTFTLAETLNLHMSIE